MARAPKNPALPPSQRINLGCIGVGGRAAGAIPSLTSDGHAVPVAFCDVDFGGLVKNSGNLEAWPDVARFQDFRVMLDKMGKDRRYSGPPGCRRARAHGTWETDIHPG